ncbi:hypothetical protein V8B55DRAFT_1441499 [Mucor lusitanicus]
MLLILSSSAGDEDEDNAAEKFEEEVNQKDKEAENFDEDTDEDNHEEIYEEGRVSEKNENSSSSYEEDVHGPENAEDMLEDAIKN